MKISVVVTAYNHEKYITQCLESVLMQKGDFQLEVIVGDDFSIDNTRAIVEEFQRKDPGIITVLPAEKNLGITKNLKRCLSTCSGEYIAICEGDDYWTDEYKLQKQKDFLDLRQDCSMCFSALLLYYEDKNVMIPHPAQSALQRDFLSMEDLIGNNYIGNFSCCMYRTEVVRKLPQGIYDLEINTDDWIIGMACSQFGMVGFLPEKMSVYRIHSGGYWSGRDIFEQLDFTCKHLDVSNRFFAYKYDELFQQRKKGFEEEIARQKALAESQETNGAPIKHFEKEHPDDLQVQKPPKVSVILTTYNSEKYLRESIESALNQTYKDFELIIWYDESTDDSWNIISEYTDERIRVFRNESNKYVAHFQRAISDVARGEYIAIHHSDDVWELDKLEKQVSFLDVHPEIGAVFTRVSIIGENSEPFEDMSHIYSKVFDQPNRTCHEWLNHFFYVGNGLCHPSVLIRKLCYAECGLYRYGLSQANDLDMWIRLCLKYDIYILQDKLVRFRVRANEMNASGDRPDAHIRGVFDLFQILNNYRSINTAEEFIKVFPNSSQYFKSEGYDMGFALAMAALEPTTPIYKKLFGLQLLYEALNDLERAKRIRELYRFTYTDFYVLAAQYDVFSTVLIPSLSAQLAEKQILLSELQNSMAWSLIVRLRRLRLWIAPQRSKREKLLKIIYQSLRMWKNEGLTSVYRKAKQMISRRFAVVRGRYPILVGISNRSKKRSAASPLDLRAISKVQTIPSSYDVIFLSSIKWKFSSQGPQQLARDFAQDGHRVFYLSTMFGKGAKTKVRQIEKNIFEVQLSGPRSMRIDSDSFNIKNKDSILAIVSSLRNELVIADAICIMDESFWKSIAISLQDRFGWRLIDLSASTSSPEEWLNCFETALRADLREEAKHLDFAASETGEDHYTRIKQTIPFLFPKASIVIVTYNNVEYTRLCLESIYEKTIYPNFEVIVVDNASTDGTPEFLGSCESKYEHIQVIYNATNEGFARANNFGIARARGDYIVLLNNDTAVTSVWLSRLVDHLDEKGVGLVGSVTNGVSNEAYVEMSFTNLDELDMFATQLAKERSNILTPIKMLAMYCVAGRTAVFQQVGPLDEQFGIGMFEDDDYSLRVRQAGYRIAVAEDVFVHHFGRSGFKIMGNERYLALFEENRTKFQSKWNIEWTQHVNGTLTENRQLSADLQNILNAYPDARGVIIFPPTIGWNISLFQRPHQLARTFAKKGFLVFFCTEAPIDNLRGFRKINHGLFLANIPWAVFDLIERPVVFTLPYNREYLFQLRQPCIVYEVIDDLDVFPGDKSRLQKNHDILLKEANVVVVTADRLMAQVKHIRTDAIMCPNAVELDHFSQVTKSEPKSIPSDLASIVKKDRPVIGYYGALARWFDYDLIRQAAQKHSDWDFLFIGPNHDNTLMASNILSMPNIHWLGARDYSQLPNYLRFFTVATIPFVVNNITLATSPIKLFEYMAAGKPIVTSDLPECRKYPGVFVAHNAEEFIDHLEHALTLIHDTAYLQQLYETVQENTWETRVNQLADALKRH